MVAKQFTTLLTAAIIITLLSSCHNYYKVTTLTPPDARQTGAKLDSFSAANSYSILRNGTGEAYHITNLQLGNDHKTAEVLLKAVDADHQLYFKEGVNKNMRYQRLRIGRRSLMNEVHVYVTYDTTAKEGHYTLKLDNVQKIDVLKHDTKRSLSSHVLGGIGYGLAGFGLFIAGLALFWHPHF
jgi:hypothetical protein